MGPGTFNRTDQAEKTQTQPASDRVTSAQAEVTQIRAASGRMVPTASTDSAHALFGTPTITHGDATTTPATGDAHPAATATTSATTGDAHSAATATTSATTGDAHSSAASSKAGQWLPDHLTGALDFTIQGIRGAGQSIGTFGSQIGDAFSHTGSAASAALAAADNAMQHPAAAAEAVGTAIKNGATATAQAVINHPVQAALIAGAVAVDVATLGTASPLLTAVGAAGAAFTAHDAWNAGAAVSRDADKISPMFNASGATAQQMKLAQDTAASDVGSATLGLATTATGIGIGAKLARLEGVSSSTTSVIASTDETAAAATETASNATPRTAPANDNGGASTGSSAPEASPANTGNTGNTSDATSLGSPATINLHLHYRKC